MSYKRRKFLEKRRIDIFNMNNKTMQRDASLDVIRIVALFSVISVDKV